MKLILLILNFIGCFLSLIAISERLHLYEILAFSNRERKLLYDKNVDERSVGFFNGVTKEAGLPIIVVAKECCSESFEQFLTNHTIHFTRVTLERDFSPAPKSSNEEFTLKFQEWPAVTEWVDKMASQYSSYMRKIVIGTTNSNRELFIIKIAKEDETTKHCAVFILAGEEGRDWLSPAITLHLMKQFVRSNKLLTGLTEFYDFYFMPFFNPDGYQYSIKSDITWAKNRKDFFPYKSCYDNGIIGVNVDRNWLSKSATGCTAVNLGLSPLSEQETSSLARFLSGIAPQTLAFINVRAFMRLITIPSSNNYDILDEIIGAAISNLKNKHGIDYTYGNKDNLLYNFTSCATDWVKWKLNIPLVYTLYMKYEDHDIPMDTDIEPLSIELALLLQHTLDIGREIYGPLMNHQMKPIQCQFNIIILLLHKFIIN